jgi:hypothetical protein
LFWSVCVHGVWKQPLGVAKILVRTLFMKQIWMVPLIRAGTMVFNVEALKVFKGVICKKILEPSLREQTPLARKPSSNRRLTSHCTNLSSVISI